MEINLCELLKGHEGETFYSPCYGTVCLDSTSHDNIIIHSVKNCKKHTLTSKGCRLTGEECMLFPARLYKFSTPEDIWNKWAEEQKSPKTWSEMIKQDKSKSGIYLPFNDIDTEDYTLIEKSAIALLKIHQLIEIGYGGNITNEEWDNPHTVKYVIGWQNGTFKNGILKTDTVHLKYHIAFHTEAQRDEFFSYPENVQLIREFYQMLKLLNLINYG